MNKISPIPPASFSSSWPKHRPRQKDNVHHKIKDEQHNTGHVQNIDNWMNSAEAVWNTMWVINESVWRSENVSSNILMAKQFFFFPWLSCYKLHFLTQSMLNWEFVTKNSLSMSVSEELGTYPSPNKITRQGWVKGGVSAQMLRY